MKTVDIITSLLLILLSILGLINTNSFTKDSALVPRIILISILILSAILLIRSIIAKSTERPKIIWDRWIKAVIVTILYIVLIPILGFYISTILYNFSMLFIYGVRNKKILIGVPSIFTLVIYLVFTMGLSIMMPKSIFM